MFLDDPSEFIISMEAEWPGYIERDAELEQSVEKSVVEWRMTPCLFPNTLCDAPSIRVNPMGTGSLNRCNGWTVSKKSSTPSATESMLKGGWFMHVGCTLRSSSCSAMAFMTCSRASRRRLPNR